MRQVNLESALRTETVELVYRTTSYEVLDNIDEETFFWLLAKVTPARDAIRGTLPHVYRRV